MRHDIKSDSNSCRKECLKTSASFWFKLAGLQTAGWVGNSAIKPHLSKTEGNCYRLIIFKELHQKSYNMSLSNFRIKSRHDQKDRCLTDGAGLINITPSMRAGA